MTAQINDIFKYGGVDYSIAGISEGNLFDTSVFSLHIAPPSSSCCRGYQLKFKIEESKLILDKFLVNLVRESGYKSAEGPVINGIRPYLIARKDDEGGWHEENLFNNQYRNLNYLVRYSGGLLLAHGFIPHGNMK